MNEANREDNNVVQAAPAAPQMNYPQMNEQWIRPPDAPAYNVPPASHMWNVPPASQMWNVPPAQQFHNFPVTQQWNAIAAAQITQSPAFHQTFLKGKPKALGIVLIVVGIIHIGLGVGTFFTASYLNIISGIPFWGAVFYIIAGSLSVAGHSRPSICLVKGSLALNIIATVVSALGVIFTCVDFAINYWSLLDCRHYYCEPLIHGGNIVRSFFIITYLLLFSISISISVFGCKALNHPSSNAPQMLVIQNGAAFTVPSSAYLVPSPANVQSPPAPTYYMAQGAVKS
ncbi:membrane-spanning 4-domains subfamily A member 15-like [Pseudophryne corroboree]|uniref:membrane-spanning 4-domains subfamily A member 15-like n=1 Tax=Pseudophryne corroboree TaxID=495146 RepID=UPI0030817E42